MVRRPRIRTENLVLHTDNPNTAVRPKDAAQTICGRRVAFAIHFKCGMITVGSCGLSELGSGPRNRTSICWFRASRAAVAPSRNICVSEQFVRWVLLSGALRLKDHAITQSRRFGGIVTEEIGLQLRESAVVRSHLMPPSDQATNTYRQPISSHRVLSLAGLEPALPSLDRIERSRRAAGLPCHPEQRHLYEIGSPCWN